MNKTWFPEWEGFHTGKWTDEVDTRLFIQMNYKPYIGTDDFLAGPTVATEKLWAKVMDLTKQERENGGVLDADEDLPASITSHGPGYIDQKLEKVIGVQTEKPFKRAMMPNGGVRMVEAANESYGFKVSPRVVEIFTKYRKSHNQGVFDAYTDDMRACRKSHIITGLPDAYGRGRIIGDYRRLALYGADFLIAQKEDDKKIPRW